MRKTFKYRLNPTKFQRTKLNQTIELCRKVYNDTLALRKDTWEKEHKSISLYDTNKILTGWKQERPELNNVFSQVLQNVQERVDLAFKAFFRRVKAGQKNGYPRFKGFGRYDSFTFKQSGFKLSDRLFISKIGDIKINLHRPVEGKIKTVTIQRDRLGNWYACFSCEVETKPLLVSSEMVGIDLGLTTFATLSNGETIERERWLKRDEQDLKRIQRKVSKLAKGSPERKKAIKALNHVHTRIKNCRDNFAHQESRKLVNRYGLIVFEKLDIDGMQTKGNRTINKGIADVAWSQFVSKTHAKAEEAGRGFILVDPKNTTQQCSGCGLIVPKDLSVRIHHCPDCGLKIGRDLNAALNILARGLSSLRL
ncbi:MAG: transposase [Peptococcaceae bacterium]|nr:MAG: transposase [Peptococcaceae bacterium]